MSKYYSYHFFTALFVLIAYPVVGQDDTTLILPKVHVQATQLSFQLIGDQVMEWDSASLNLLPHQSVSDLLGQEGNVYVKNYGPGSISTVSSRGSSAGQTVIAWNGLSIQSPMLGLNDFSLIPLAFTDEVSLQYGGNSSRWGSGAIGGVVNLRNTPTFNKKLSAGIKTAAGSFGSFHQQLSVKSATPHFASSTRLIFNRSDNDFPYRIQANLPEQNQTNSSFNQYGALQEFYKKTKKAGIFGIHLWGQRAVREIPPTTVQNRSEARQKDLILRAGAHWKKLHKNSITQARAGVFREEIDYKDPSLGIQAVSHFWTIIGEAEHKWELLPHFHLLTGVNQTYIRATTEAYNSTPGELQHALFAAFHKEMKDWNLQLNIRHQWVDGKSAALIPAFSWEGPVTKWLGVRGKITRNFRLPTFNDRFWMPGGNAQLKPESGWSQELGIFHETKNERGEIIFESTAYHRKIRNWILWSPQVNQNYWSAGNLTEVRSRGLSQKLSWARQMAPWLFTVSAGYDFTLSTNEKAIELPELAAGEQLIYVPRHQAYFSINVHLKELLFHYHHRYTGKVNTTSGTLPGFSLSNLRIQSSFAKNYCFGSIYFSLNNIFNKSYRVVERRPMPGRHFTIGCQVDFHRPTKNH